MPMATSKREIYDKVSREIARLGDLIGGGAGQGCEDDDFTQPRAKDFDLPPKTASILRELRASRVEAFNRARAEQQNHLGWHAYGAMHGYDALAIIHPVLIAELAEIHDEPIGLVSALRIRIRDEPALMKGYILGASPLLLTKEALAMSTMSGEVEYCTPAMVRAAWAGASLGWWDAEELLMHLPPMYGVDQETAMAMMTDADVEPSVTLA